MGLQAKVGSKGKTIENRKIYPETTIFIDYAKAVY
jgi:hypothetical protein